MFTTQSRRTQVLTSATLAVAALASGASYATASSTAAGSTASSSAASSNTAASSAAYTAPTPHVHTWLQTSTPALKKCYPYAKAKVTVYLTADKVGKDTFLIEASGLRPRTQFTVFLLEKAGPPFGAAEYIGDFTTDRYGRAKNTYNLIVEEAFAFNNEKGSRTDLNSVGFWFADPKADDGCLGVKSPVTGFDGDAQAGVQMMNSGAFKLP